MFCPVFTKTCSNGKMLGRIVLGERVLERISNLVVCLLSILDMPYQNHINNPQSLQISYQKPCQNYPQFVQKPTSTVPHIKTYLTNRKDT